MSGSTEPTGVPPIALPWRLRALNGLDPLIGRWLTPEASARHYMDAARTATGLDDFGPYDVETAAERLLSMLREEIDLHLFGKIAVSRLLQRNLENCLKIQHAFVEDPSLAEVDVERPIIIVCTPRTGSTLLHNLLAQHPNARAPQMWELHRPCPPPKPELARHDPRIAMSDREFGLYYRLIPEMRAIHYFAPQAVEECTHLFLNTLTCRMSFSVTAGLNSYVRWATELDMVPAYREYKRMLQILTRHYPNRTLILKSPAHLLCMDALATVFPSARVVHIHRDPATAAGSFCSLAEAVQISMRRDVDPTRIAKVWRQQWAPAMHDSIRWHNDASLRVVDVHFRDVVREPVKTVSSIFAAFGIDVPNALPDNVEQYLREHPKHEYGAHRYDLARYGLSGEALHALHAPYVDYFQIPVESALAGVPG